MNQPLKLVSADRIPSAIPIGQQPGRNRPVCSLLTSNDEGEIEWEQAGYAQRKFEHSIHIRDRLVIAKGETIQQVAERLAALELKVEALTRDLDRTSRPEGVEWLIHEGKGCPTFIRDLLVSIKRRDGSTVDAELGFTLSGWIHDGTGNDILWYRPIRTGGL